MRKKRQNKPKPAAIQPYERNGLLPYINRFLEWCLAKNYSPRTVEIRQNTLRYFIQWCDERNLNQPQDITRPILERYRRHLFYYRKVNGEPLSFATQQQRLQPLRIFFKWLAKENYILYNPASELELPRVHRRLPKHLLTFDDIEKILNQTMLHGELGIRDRAIIETLYSTGIRRAELINLKLYDIDTRNGSVMIREGKGRKDRMVPLGERACLWINKYLEEVRPELVIEPDDGTLFLHEYGEAFKNNRLTDLVKKYIETSGVNKPGACHIFRHSMATHMLENGADIRYIQAILGHSVLSTTEIYTQVTIRKLKEVHRLTHPSHHPQAGQHRHDADELLDTLNNEIDEELLEASE